MEENRRSRATDPDAGSLFAGPGEMRERCRALDWAATALGPVERWPDALRSAVRLTLDSGFAMCVYAGPELVLVYNDGFVHALGVTKHPRALGRPAREVWAEIWAWIAPELERVLGGGAPIHHVNQPFVIERDGRTEQTFWTYAFSAIRGEDGTVVGVHNVVDETTGRVLAERRAEAILEHMRDAHCVLDREFRIVTVNAAAERLLGVSREQLVGRSHWEAFPASVDAPIGRAFRRVVAEGVEQHLTHHYTGEGYDLHLEVDAYPTEEGGVAMFWRDVTKRVRADEALRASEARYRTIFDSIDEGFVIAEVLYDQDGRPIDALYLEGNPAASRRTGVPDYSGRRLSEIMPGAEPYWPEVYARVARTGVAERLERYLSPIGRWYDFQVSRVSGAGPDGAADAAPRLAIVFQDVTGRRRAEEALRESEARQAFLVRLSDALRPLTDPVAVQTTAMRMLAERLGVMRASYFEIEEDGDTFHLAARFERDATPMPERMRLSDFSPALGDAYRSGRTLTVPDTSVLGEFVDDPAPYAAIGVAAWAAVPLMRDGRLVAWIGVHSSSRREWRAAELQVLHDVAERTWGAAERARTEAALRESEAKYRTVFESIDEGFNIHEVIRDNAGKAVDYRLVDANPAYTRITGLSRDTIGKLGSEYMPDVEGYWLETMDRVSRSGVAERAEMYNAPTGRWYNMQVTRIAGHPDRLGIVFDDVTARKEAELALKASEERQAFLLQLSDALGPLDAAAEIQGEATRLLRGHLAAGWCYYVEWDEAAARGVVLRDATRDGLPSLAGTHDVSDVPAYLDLLRTGDVLNVGDYASFEALSPELRARYTALGFRSMLVATLVKQGRLVASLLVGDTEVRDWSGDAEALLLEVAERTWAAVERARAESALRVSEARYRTIFESIDEGFAVAEVVYDDEGRPVDLLYLEANPAAARLTAGTAFARRRLSEVLPETDLTSLRIYDSVARTGKAEQTERYYAALDRWFESHISPVIDGERGGTNTMPRRVAIVFDDITDRKREEGRREFLLALSDALRRLADPREIQAAATRMLRERLGAGWCYYVEWDERGAFGEVLHDAAREGLPSLAGRHDVSDVPDFLDFLRSGQAFSVGDFARFELMSPRIRARYGALGFRSMVGAPIVNDGRLVTTLLVGDTAPREWSDDAVALVREVADQTWTALARARASEALRASAERQAFLLTLSDALRPLVDPIEIQIEAARVLGRHLGASRAMYSEVEADDAHFVVHRDYTDGVPSLAGRHLLDGFGPDFIRDHRAGRILTVSDAARDDRVGETRLAAFAAAGIGAFVGVPLVKGGRLAASLSVHFPVPHDWSAAEVALIEETAERTWAAVERARAEAALRASEERFRTMADLVPDLLWQSEPDGSTPWYNARWLEYTGQTLEQAHGWEWMEAIHPDDRARSAANYTRAAERGEAVVQEHRIRRHDGVYRWFLVRAEPLRDEAGRVIRWFGAATDVHAQRMALEEAERLARARTAERDTLRRQLAAAEEGERRRLARELHDQLGQQLTALALGLEDARRIAKSGSSGPGELAPEALRPLLDRLERLQRLTRDMTIGARYLALELRPPELDDMGLENALATYVREWRGRFGIAADLMVAGGVREALPPDARSALYRIAQEALTNAAKHARATSVSVIVEQVDGHVRLIVEDDGRGMDLERVVDRARRERRLGLAGMQERAALLDGEVKIESSPGHGTTVYARLPLGVPTGRARASEPEDTP